MTRLIIVNKRYIIGVTLLELIFVVAIIVVLFAIAVPLFMKSKIPANETSAIVSLRALITDQESYRIVMSEYGDFDKLADEGFLSDVNMKSGRKTGYSFICRAPQVNFWYAQATPDTYGKSGYRTFYVDDAGSIKAYDQGKSGFVPVEDVIEWGAIKE